MSSNNYPDYLNPFDEDEDNSSQVNEYPDHLDPFGHENEPESTYLKSSNATDDYDDSLNPFENEAEKESTPVNKYLDSCGELNTNANNAETIEASNPFDHEPEPEPELPLPLPSPKIRSRLPIDGTNSSHLVTKVQSDETSVAEKISPSPDPPSLEHIEPPKPLPRTKSLLKKELALKRRQQELERSESAMKPYSTQQATNEVIVTNDGPNNTFQRRKNKRAAPPVPVNFKRQVLGSIDAIENELNGIGDNLSSIEEEFVACQKILKAPGSAEQTDFEATKARFVDLIKRKNSIVRRQKELMYQKREMKLDQIHSDIEYELRMIGNKQVSTRTSEDEAKEKVLLKRLVEIVEEKSDIVENLNKESTSDEQEINEALARLNLNIEDNSLVHSEKSSANNPSPSPPAKTGAKQEICDKLSLNKFSKIATLLPKGNTIKGTMKLKRKHLFRKNHDSQSSIDG